MDAPKGIFSIWELLGNRLQESWWEWAMRRGEEAAAKIGIKKPGGLGW